MNKNKRNRNLSLLLILAIISLVVLVSSFARYTSDLGTVPGTAKVATWNVAINKTADSNIFKHEYTTNLTAKDEDGNYIIAPGVEGAYKITITNNGDVAASVDTFDITETAGNAAVPMEFSTDGTTWGTLETAKTALETAATTKTVGAGASEVVVGTLYWRWPYNTVANTTTDEKDTNLGTASYTAKNAVGETADRTSYGLTISMIATQVAPTK